MFNVTACKSTIDFSSNEKAKIYSLKNHLNIKTTEMNPDYQSYLNQLYEIHLCFFNISSYLTTIEEVIQILWCKVHWINLERLLLHSEKTEEIYNRSTLPVLVTKILNNKQKTVLLMKVMMKYIKNWTAIKMLVKIHWRNVKQ